MDRERLKEKLNPKGSPRRKFVIAAIIGLLLFLLLLATAAAYMYMAQITDSKADDKITESQEPTKPEEITDDITDEEPEEKEPEEDIEQPPSDTPPDPNPTPTPTPTPDPTPAPTTNWWSYPSPTLPVTRSGNDLLVLVNKQYQLPSTYAPSDLVNLSQQPNLNIRLTGTFYLRSVLIDDLRNLANAAQTASLDMSIKSAYRSYSTQQSTYQYWVNYNGGDTDAADTVSARAGHSQHQLGTAVDFSSSEVGDQIGEVFHNTAAAAWLRDHAWEYGFVIAYPQGAESITRYSYESWHYRYIGVANAAEWRASGLIFEEWLAARN